MDRIDKSKYVLTGKGKTRRWRKKSANFGETTSLKGRNTPQLVRIENTRRRILGWGEKALANEQGLYAGAATGTLAASGALAAGARNRHLAKRFGTTRGRELTAGLVGLGVGAGTFGLTRAIYEKRLRRGVVQSSHHYNSSEIENEANLSREERDHLDRINSNLTAKYGKYNEKRRRRDRGPDVPKTKRWGR